MTKDIEAPPQMRPDAAFTSREGAADLTAPPSGHVPRTDLDGSPRA
ncbi:hypothetical protein [Streptomyces sp. MZ04]|nr:hypothetical protein [Streptomyces sp. MZ04]